MCGILGLYSPSGIQPYLSALQAANDIVSYRGPDGAGFVLFHDYSSKDKDVSRLPSLSGNPLPSRRTNLALAHRRLAILDLSAAGLQPMCNQDSLYWITYNGEVYNYIELRRELEASGHSFTTQTDTEVILHAYQHWGERCVERFNGMWSFGIADLKAQRIFCSRDRFGIKPFHYFFDGEHFAFASEIKQLLLFPFIPRKMNEQIAYEYLSFQALEHTEETFFQGVRSLLPGHNLIFDLKYPKLTASLYYDPRFSINEKITLSESSEEFHSLLKDSVSLRLRSDVPVGSCLSGGLDSSSIVCLIHTLLEEQCRHDIQHTFSSHFDEKEANELEYMEAAIHTTNVNAHFTYPTSDGLISELEKIVWHQEEPFGSTSIYAQWSVFKLASENGVKVMLDGQGADELLAGYIPYSTNIYLKELFLKKNLLLLLHESRRFDAPVLEIILPLVLYKLTGSLKKSPRLHRAIKKLRSGRDTKAWLNPDAYGMYEEQSFFAANKHMLMFGEHEHLNNYLYQLTFKNNLQALLKYEDRNSMAFSVEGRVPFLDYRIVEFLFSLPSSFKMKDGYSKYVFRQAMDGVLPDKIRKRITKLGFSTPEDLWQKTVLSPLIENALDNPKLKKFIDPIQAKAHLLKLRTSGQSDFTPWRWANLSLWMKAFDIGPA